MCGSVVSSVPVGGHPGVLFLVWQVVSPGERQRSAGVAPVCLLSHFAILMPRVAGLCFCLVMILHSILLSARRLTAPMPICRLGTWPGGQLYACARNGRYALNIRRFERLVSQYGHCKV